MAYMTQIIGGFGGSPFSFTGESTGATLKKIGVWVGGWQVKAVKIWLTDNQIKQFGRPGGKYSEFEFADGEKILALSLWDNNDGDRLGAIKFTTTSSREFFTCMIDRRLERELRMNVGSGICLGVAGRACADIDSMGFMFIGSVRSAVLTNVNYPTYHQVIPEVAMENIKSCTYTNNSEITQSYKVETSKKLSKKSSWSLTNKLDTTLSIRVKAEIPEVEEGGPRFKLRMGEQGTYDLENSEEKTETISFPVQIPPRKTVVVDFTIGRATVNLPYNGIVKITCYNGSSLTLFTNGTYSGVTYTDVKTSVNEK